MVNYSKYVDRCRLKLRHKMNETKNQKKKQMEQFSQWPPKLCIFNHDQHKKREPNQQISNAINTVIALKLMFTALHTLPLFVGCKLKCTLLKMMRKCARARGSYYQKAHVENPPHTVTHHTNLVQLIN